MDAMPLAHRRTGRRPGAGMRAHHLRLEAAAEAADGTHASRPAFTSAARLVASERMPWCGREPAIRHTPGAGSLAAQPVPDLSPLSTQSVPLSAVAERAPGFV